MVALNPVSSRELRRGPVSNQSRVTLGVAEGREVLRPADQDCVQGDLHVDAVIEVVQSDHSVTLYTASSSQQYL